MRTICFIFFLIFFQPVAYSQLSSSYAVVDKYVQNFPMKIGSAGDLRVFIKEMSRVFTKDDEKVRAVYYWITENIGYDCTGYHNGLLISREIDDILRSRKAVCSGYAALMQFGCDAMNIECKTISGAARVHEQDIFFHPDSLKSNHAWNAVKLNGEWKLIDATWASGYSDKDVTKFIKERKDAYFFMQPARFIYTHLPDDSAWQLLKDTVVTPGAFCNQPFIWTSYFEYQIENAEPFTLNLNKKVGDTIRFKFCSGRPLAKIMIYSDEKRGVHVTDSLLKTGDCYFYNYVVRQIGKYDLNIGFSDRGNGSDKENQPGIYTTVIMYRLEVKELKTPSHKVR